MSILRSPALPCPSAEPPFGSEQWMRGRGERSDVVHWISAGRGYGPDEHYAGGGWRAVCDTLCLPLWGLSQDEILARYERCPACVLHTGESPAIGQ